VSDDRLPFHVKFIYGLGDHSVNVALVALTMIFPFYLTEVVGMRIGLAGLVPLAGRSVDAISDVMMGRISDRTRWKAGRRRPYLLLGAIPFGLSFAAIWAAPDIESTSLEFAYYAGLYALVSISMTVVAVPYQALMPDLTDSYDERTSLATFRSVSSLIGTLLIALAFRPMVNYFGGDTAAWALVGGIFGVWIVWPWLPIWWVTFERSTFSSLGTLTLGESMRVFVRNKSFRQLLGFFALGRIAIDLPLALFLHYFTYVIGRPEYFEPMMVSFLLSTVFAMPIWLRFSKGQDKSTIYIYACVGWMLTFVGLFSLQADWPLWLMLLVGGLSGAGYAAADMMPWSMVADVADEDELLSGERREGLYIGVFTFVRKICGAIGVALAFAALDRVGFVANTKNPDEVLWAIRGLTALVPGLFVFTSLLIARGYTLSHARHAEILAELDRRRSQRAA
jgi:glycoside/pentoside/hexuronide:cation symporter, GPH family